MAKDLELDTTAWPEVGAELDRLNLQPSEIELLVNHLSDRLIGHFGAENFDVWRAKEGLHRHAAIEVAAVAIAKLAPLLDQLPPGTVSSAAKRGEIASPIKFPWDETFPFG